MSSPKTTDQPDYLARQDVVQEVLGRAPRVLVADNDLYVQKLLRYHLQRLGAQVWVAGDAQEVVPLLKKLKIDLLLLDLGLQGAGGLELLEKTISKNWVAFVITLSHQASPDEEMNAIRLGAFDYIRKSSSFDDMRLAIRNGFYALALQAQVAQLQAALDNKRKSRFPDIIGDSPALKKALEMVEKVMDRDISVYLAGESGSGKELFAQAIHFGGAYKDKPFVAINCAAIPTNLLESELFGHEKGAFTGADARHVGKFEEANGGTLFLDEVGELDLTLQAKLLRVLQTQEVQPLGGKTRKVKVRIISATNADLLQDMQKGIFRQDLYYRLVVFPIRLPPLRERGRDIVTLARHFIKRFAEQERREVKGMRKEVEAALMAYDWPGNVRELENLMLRAVVLAESEYLDAAAFPELQTGGGNPGGTLGASALRIQPEALPVGQGLPAARSTENGMSGMGLLHDAERSAIVQALSQFGGNMSRAALMLGIGRATLYRKAKKYSIPLKTE